MRITLYTLYPEDYHTKAMINMTKNSNWSIHKRAKQVVWLEHRMLPVCEPLDEQSYSKWPLENSRFSLFRLLFLEGSNWLNPRGYGKWKLLHIHYQKSANRDGGKFILLKTSQFHDVDEIHKNQEKDCHSSLDEARATTKRSLTFGIRS